MSEKKEDKKAAEKGEKGKEAAATTPEDEAKQKKKKLLIMAIGGVVAVGAIGGGAAMFLGKKKAEPAAAEVADHGAPKKPDEHSAEKKPDEHAAEKKPDEHSAEKKPDEHAAEKKPDEHGAPADAKDAHGKEVVKGGEGAGTTDAAPDFGQTYSFSPFNINLGNPMDSHYARMEVTVEFFGGPEQEGELKKRLPQLRDGIVSVASKKSREFLLGPDGKDQLRLEIKNRLNQYMTRKIENVYITDILIE